MVFEEDYIFLILVVRGKDDNGNFIGFDEYEVLINYVIIIGNLIAYV